MFRPSSLLAPSSPPRSFLPLRILPQGSRGFYVRAYRAPPHAPDMLTVRIQVIDGTGTFTLSDSQPCRLLLCLQPRLLTCLTLRRFYQAGRHTAEVAAKCPEPLCPTSVLPPLGRRVPSPLRALPLRHRSYGLMCHSRWALSCFGI